MGEASFLGLALWLAASPGQPAPAPAGERPPPAAAPAQAALTPPPEPLQAAASDYARRNDLNRLDSSIERYREASRLRPGSAAAELGLARALAFRAQSTRRTARVDWGESARAAERALREAAPAWAASIDRGETPERAAALVPRGGAEPLYWLALGTMGLAEARGMAAVLAVKDGARAMMERAAELDERVDAGGPRRALGAWVATLPSAAGGGAAAARAHFARARGVAPAAQLTPLREAATLAVLVQDGARFDALLREVLAFDPARAPELAPENRLAQRLARELAARRGRLF